MIDEETERAVAGWVELGDRVSGARESNGDTTPCARCGTTFRLLGHGDHVLCARCYLERGDTPGDTSPN